MTDQVYQVSNNNNFSIRENLVQTAVKFLTNPKVATSPLERKQEFLKKKGLNEEEISRACELAGISNQNQNDFTAVSIPERQPIYPYYQYRLQKPTVLQRIHEIFSVTALIGATIYSLYWFYKKFIEPFLFGRKKKDNIETVVSNLDKTVQTSVKDMKESIVKVENDVHRLVQQQTPDPSIGLLVQELKQDLSSLKALLLSRKQFPSAPASIPAWQLDTRNQGPCEKGVEREDDAGSGSSTNNSDSSLEMIREDPPKE
ncbi:peroxisomal membrane protein PEX14 [Prorops nasuta]|uniref:peroxisomal membrane protein PEX14 n=1 Tax=Prorops nasuta TaxID=863751 RepID=UPI0034CE3453